MEGLYKIFTTEARRNQPTKERTCEGVHTIVQSQFPKSSVKQTHLLLEDSWNDIGAIAQSFDADFPLCLRAYVEDLALD